jgi:hypothetical protein
MEFVVERIYLLVLIWEYNPKINNRQAFIPFDYLILIAAEGCFDER